MRASYLQIYNEIISDLLKPDRTNLTIREDKKKGVFVEGLSEWVVRSPKEVYGELFSMILGVAPARACCSQLLTVVLTVVLTVSSCSQV